MTNETDNAVSPPKVTQEKTDILKWLLFFISSLGILAWIAGAAYQAGYWGVVGLDGPLIPRSLQATALMGFIGSLTSWIYAPMVLLVLSVLILFLGIGLRRKENKNDTQVWLVKTRDWLSGRFSYDQSLGVFGLTGMAFSYGFLILLEIPLVVWSMSAYHQGEKLFKEDACEIRNGIKLGSRIKLAEGNSIEGRILDRSDKFVVISNGWAIYSVALDSQILAYSIDIPTIECEK